MAEDRREQEEHRTVSNFKDVEVEAIMEKTFNENNKPYEKKYASIVAPFVDETDVEKMLVDETIQKEEKGEKLKFACQICPKVFSEPVKLERHNLIHEKLQYLKQEMAGTTTEIKQSDLSSNDQSNEDMMEAKSSASIRKSISKMSRFSCDDCSQTFKLKGSLKKHSLDKHTLYQDLPFICTICNLRMKRFEYLRKHMKKEHEINQTDSDEEKFKTDINQFVNLKFE